MSFDRIARVLGFFAYSGVLFLIMPVAAEEADAGDWIDFTTGKELAGVTTEGNWTLREGIISLDPRQGEEGWTRFASYLWLDGDYRDFVCEFDFKFGSGGNSGFYFRVADVAEPVRTGVEVQLTDCHGKERIGWHDLGGIIRFTSAEIGNPLVNEVVIDLARKQLPYDALVDKIFACDKLISW